MPEEVRKALERILEELNRLIERSFIEKRNRADAVVAATLARKIVQRSDDPQVHVDRALERAGLAEFLDEKPPILFEISDAQQLVRELTSGVIAEMPNLTSDQQLEVFGHILKNVLVDRPRGAAEFLPGMQPSEAVAPHIAAANSIILQRESEIRRFPDQPTAGMQFGAMAQGLRSQDRISQEQLEIYLGRRAPTTQEEFDDFNELTQTLTENRVDILAQAGARDKTSGLVRNTAQVVGAETDAQLQAGESLFPIFPGQGVPEVEPLVPSAAEELAGDFKTQLERRVPKLPADASTAAQNARTDLINEFVAREQAVQDNVRRNNLPNDVLLRTRQGLIQEAEGRLQNDVTQAEFRAEQVKAQEEAQEEAQTTAEAEQAELETGRTPAGAKAIRNQFLFDQRIDSNTLDEAGLLTIDQAIARNGGTVEGIEGFIKDDLIPVLQANKTATEQVKEFGTKKKGVDEATQLFFEQQIATGDVTPARLLQIQNALARGADRQQIIDALPALVQEKENLDLAANTTQLEQAAETALGITAGTPTQVRKSLKSSVVELASLFGSELEKDPQGADVNEILGNLLGQFGATPFGLRDRPDVQAQEDIRLSALSRISQAAGDDPATIGGRSLMDILGELEAFDARTAAEVEADRLDPSRPPTFPATFPGLPGFSRGRVEKSLAFAPTSELTPLLERALFDRPELAEFVSQGDRAQRLQRQVRDIRRDRRNERVGGALQSLKPLPFDQRVDALMASRGIDREAAKDSMEKLGAMYGEQVPVLKDATDPVGEFGKIRTSLLSSPDMPLQEAFTQAFSSLTREFEATPGAEAERRRALRESAAQRRTVIRR
jgi:hypothetical protein